MKIKPIVQLMLLVTLLIGSSEEFFFEYPKKALTEFFQSLKAKKQPPKAAMNNIQHYHVHYYPMPVPLVALMKAPDKRYLEKLYEDTIRSFGWSDLRYKYVPEPSVVLSPGLQQLWDEPWDEEILLEPEDASIDRTAKGILVQVPVNRQFILHLLKKPRQRQTAT